MRRVHAGPLAGLAGVLALLGTLEAAVGLGGLGWGLGVACGTVGCGFLAGALSRHRATRLGPANAVTLVRFVLGCGVAALTADAFARPVPVTLLVALSAVALSTDRVDGWVARRRHVASALGARFDMEVDAFLILVLSVYVAHTTAWWVLAIGAWRYVLVAAQVMLPRLRGSVPPRYWCKVVAVLQGVVLVVAAAGVLPAEVSQTALAVALLLLTESFGREIGQRWRAGKVGRQESAGVDLSGAMSHG